MATFTDTFLDNTNNWNVKDNAEISMQIENGGYVIEHRQETGWWLIARNFGIQSHGELGIQVKIQKILGASDSYYGIVWGAVDINNFYYLLIKPNNQFVIGKYIGSEWNHLTVWTTAPLRRDAGSINEISITILNGNLELIINGFQVLKHRWNELITKNNIGFIVGHTMKVKVMELTITTEDSVQTPKSIPFSLPAIKRTQVDSSNLNSIGYDVKTKILEIQFNEGSIYQYYQVPQEIYVGLMKAESHGQYFSALIRGAFESSKIGYEPLQGHSKDDDYDYGDADEERWTENDIKNMLDMGDNFESYWEDAGRDD